MKTCDACNDGPARPDSGLCEYCELIDPDRPPPSARTVKEYFDEGLAQGRQYYEKHGHMSMRRLGTLKAGREGPFLEPGDIDALTRGLREGVKRAHRAFNGLPEVCDMPDCGVFGVCDSCKRLRKRRY